MKPKRRDDVALQPEADGFALLDPRTGTTHPLTPLAVEVWRRLDGTRSLQDIVTQVAQAVQEPESTGFVGDVAEVLLTFEDRGLLEF